MFMWMTVIASIITIIIVIIVIILTYMIFSFVKKSYKTPINCHHCAEFLWGFSCTGYSCEGIIIITITGVIIICEKPSTVLL